MLGVKCVAENGAVVKTLFDNGMLTVPAADNVVRLLPPLIIEESHVAEALAIMDRGFAGLAEKAA
jgi:acetylornithine/N-succinyldiaminopimelate aminotransferase